MLMLLHVAGIWMLATVGRGERLLRLRTVGRYMRYGQLAAVARMTRGMVIGRGDSCGAGPGWERSSSWW
jgi:hypothetical protein